MREEPAAHEAPPTPDELAVDGRLETLLGEAVGPVGEDPLPADFAARILELRPFAPWETRRPAVWKTPILAMAGLLMASAAVFVLPALRLGPGSALTLWAWAMLMSFTRPAAAFLSALRMIPDAGATVGRAIPGSAALLLGAGTLVSLAATALLARRLGRQAANALRG